MFSTTIRSIYKREHNIEIAYCSYGGCFSLKNIPPGVSFGNYCSIAPDIYILWANHPKSSFTTHPILFNPTVGFVNKDLLKRQELIIGHDVWIGQNTIILPSVRKIGNDAIIGAGSIVAVNVPPYTIVAGNPAKIINKRFDDETIAKLEKSEWWKLEKDELFARKKEFQDIVNFELND